jgi:hypothetical protein
MRCTAGPTRSACPRLASFRNAVTVQVGCVLGRRYDVLVSPKVAFVDVDDTLVRWAGAKPIPIPAVLERVHQLSEQGVTLYCWSAAGAEEARRVVTQLGIAKLFRDFLPKPQLLIDDQPPSEWKGLEILHPSQCTADSRGSATEVDHSDDTLIESCLARTPRERLRYLTDLVEFEHRARRAKRLE